MHELSIAESILDAVRKELANHPGARPMRIGLRIGELAAVDVDSLTFCLEAVLKGTEWESLQLDIRVCPQRSICRDCGNEFGVIEYNTTCPNCASMNTKFLSGDELNFDYLEIDIDGTPATEVQSTE